MANGKTNKQAFEELYQKELTQQEVFECESNLFGFFGLLDKIAQRNKEQSSNVTDANKQGNN